MTEFEEIEGELQEVCRHGWAGPFSESIWIHSMRSKVTNWRGKYKTKSGHAWEIFERCEKCGTKINRKILLPCGWELVNE